MLFTGPVALVQLCWSGCAGLYILVGLQRVSPEGFRVGFQAGLRCGVSCVDWAGIQGLGTVRAFMLGLGFIFVWSFGKAWRSTFF